MANMDGISTDDLERELQKRKEKEVEDSRQRILPKDKIKIDKLVKCTEDYVDFILSDNYHDDNDYRQFIFEEAIKAVYGTGFWKWMNNIKR